MGFYFRNPAVVDSSLVSSLEGAGLLWNLFTKIAQIFAVISDVYMEPVNSCLVMLVYFRESRWVKTAEPGDASSPGSNAPRAQQLVSKPEKKSMRNPHSRSSVVNHSSNVLCVSGFML